MAEFKEYWTYRFVLNICGYAVLLLPLFLIFWYYKKWPPVRSSSCFFRVVSFFVYDSEATLPLSDAPDKSVLKSQLTFGSCWLDKVQVILSLPCFPAAKLLFCFLGLQLCYLTWGYYQERVMTVGYTDLSKTLHSSSSQIDKVISKNNHTTTVSEKSVGEFFRDSQFLVLANRVCALLLSGSILLTRAILAHVQSPKRSSQTRPAACKYSLPSLSNTLSSWFQYEALKYVSFPTQVVCKSAKVVATMCMSKLINITSSRHGRVVFSTLEWVTACAISGGVCMFLLGSEYEEFKVRTKPVKSSRTEVGDYDQSLRIISGAVILVGYLASDSFTTTYQSALFKQHHVSSVTMMFAINAFSIACCATSLMLQGAFSGIWHFAVAHPEFLTHVSVISLTSAIGQLFIYYTISQFGAVTFALIMTARQVISIFISCAAFGHPVTLLGWIGLLVAVAASVVRTKSGLTRG